MANRDITLSVANFREAARHLWNCHYRPMLGRHDPWDLRDSFDRVIIDLFRSLVLEGLNVNGVSLASTSSDEPTTIPNLFVQPSVAAGVPIFIN
jgi:hypothetical protein